MPSKTLCTRSHIINMPQMYWGGLSENWFLKELGDMHWTLLTDGLGVRSDELMDSTGNRLYASFVRIRWESNADLSAFKENEQLKMQSELLRYGSKMFFSDAVITGEQKEIRASLMSVFSSREAEDNTTLKKGTPLFTENDQISRHAALPAFAKEYIELKGQLLPPENKPAASLFTYDYQIDPFDDINGVGLIYFAAFPKISDRCERHYFHTQHTAGKEQADWARSSACLSRDIFYFGNANTGDTLVYQLQEARFSDEGEVHLTAALYRKSDSALIANIYTVKRLSGKINEKATEPEIQARKESPVITREQLSHAITAFFADMLDLRHLTETTELTRLGIESVIFMELSEHLNNTFTIQSNPSRFYGCATIADILDYLLQTPVAEPLPVTGVAAADKISSPPSQDIAIIGTAFRVPGANDSTALWQLLSSATSAITDTPPEKWSWPADIDPRAAHSGINKGGYLQDIDKFDAAFFRISPREAALMDPQQRLLLELTWELLEEAGYTASAIRKSATGVYIGASGSDYEILLRECGAADSQAGTGTAAALLANRLSYFYDLNGPSLLIDTACSSSLVAVHEAVKAIQAGDCTQAIAGGIHLMCHPSRSIAYYQSNMLSADGKCHTFDEQANGYVRGEGAVLMLLKPLAAAITAGDNILAVLKGSAVNHGGQAGGLTVPNPDKQRALLEHAYRKAGIDIKTVGYIEAHGTGTSLGDPVEIAGLTAAFQNLSPLTADNIPWCGIGAVKTNIGHLEAASGIAGMLKVLLSMQHAYLPATLNYTQLNTKIELQNSPFFICHEGRPWLPAAPGQPLRAGISSFGIGGVNSHVILESFPAQQPATAQDTPAAAPYLFVLSAKDAERLQVSVKLISDYITANPATSPADLCYTLQLCREPMEERIAIVFSDLNELKKQLDSPLSGHLYTGNMLTDAKLVNIFREEPDIIKKWLQARQLHQVAKYWCYGLEVDWALLYTGQKLVKMSLPGYPFKRKHYWIEKKETPAPAQQVPALTLIQQPPELPDLPPEAAAPLTEIQLPAPTLINGNVYTQNSLSVLEIEEQLSAQLCALLYLEEGELQANATFHSLGLDSVLGIEFVKKISKAFNKEIKAAKLYDHTSVKELAAYLHSLHETPAASNTAAPKIMAPAMVQLSMVTDQQPLAVAGTETLMKPIALLDLSEPAAPAIPPVYAMPAQSRPVKQPALQDLKNLTGTVGKALCELLYMEEQELNIHASFHELGIDSILGVEFVKTINRIFNTRLKAAVVYDHSSVSSLSAYLAQQLQEMPATAAPAQQSHKAFAGFTVEGDLFSKGEAMFCIQVNTATNIFLRDHLVFDRHVLPTDAYIEFIYTVCSQQFGVQHITLEGLRINQPFTGKEGQLKLELKQLPDKRIRFVISGNTAGKETIHLRGFVKMSAATGIPALTAPQQPAKVSYNTNELRTIVNGATITGCYDTVRQSLHILDEQYAAGTLMISSAAGNVQQSYIAQILDGALLYAIQAGAVLFNKEKVPGIMYLPYQAAAMIVYAAALPDQPYSCVLCCDAKHADGALFSFDIKDPDGKLLISVRGLELRPVTLQQLWQEPATAAPMEIKSVAGSGAGHTPAVLPLDTDVAVIGMSCRLPGADNYHAYWKLLSNGETAIQEITPEHWGHYDWYHPDPHHPGTAYSKWAGFINDTDKFDSLFFGISPYEAEIMDPQQRLFLEECWKALEDAACNSQTLAGKKVSVFAGAGAGDYLHLMQEGGCEKEGAAFTGTSQAILAARISYFLNLTGPSLTIDTACSSSLVAIDRAYQSIVNGESEMALAGGIALLNTPMLHIWTSQVGMPSKDGRCKTFDDTADGIVSGEGVGVVVLKKLAAAQRDGDRIYAVIKGSGINQDGKTNGITAPSARSQQALQSHVYKQYGINPAGISYVEAHGTGTKLGDPIEINALTESFRPFRVAGQSCAIGSVKTNIGHTSFAAGVAGLIKIILMMQHGKYVPSLHYETTNSEIDITDTPFYVNTTLKDWQGPAAHPRRAAINSFGFSGTNAHLVVEEYPLVKKNYQGQGPAIVVLSAANTGRLTAQVANLKDFISLHEGLSIHDIAYTLQTGRAEMEERLAFIINSLQELSDACTQYLSGSREPFLSGNSRGYATHLPANTTAEQFIQSLTEKKEGRALANMWVKGAPVNWDLWYGNEKPARISLPVYPFARERHWVTRKGAATAVQEKAAQLHPLLHTNCSSLHEQKFTSVYTGKEPFLADHKIRGEKVLPGVAYLELARVAGQQSTGSNITQIREVTWLSPMLVNGSPEKVHVHLTPSGTGVNFNVYTEKQEKVVHCQGKLHTSVLADPEKFNLQAIQNRLTGSKNKTTYYSALAKKGFDLGKSFQGIDQHYYSADEALSKITLPVEEGYLLPPGIMDSGLQNCLGWVLSGEGENLLLPFSAGEITIYQPLPHTIWSYARKSRNSNANNTITSYDIDLLQESGEVLLSFRDFVFLSAEKTTVTHTPDLQAGAQLQVSNNSWQTALPGTKSSADTSRPALIFLIGGAPLLADRLKELLELEVSMLNPDSETSCFNDVFQRIKIIIQQKGAANILVICNNTDYRYYGFIAGLLRTATLEYPAVSGKVIGVDSLSIQDIDALKNILVTELDTADTEVRYENGARLVKLITAITAAQEGAPSLIKPGGVYLVTGGAGGLGMLFAKHISQTPGTRLILTGRTTLTDTLKQRIAAIPNAVYYACDISSKAAVQELMAAIRADHSKLDGIIHSAGVLRDSFIVKKTAAEISEVLAPKIAGVKNLDEATRNEALDFMLFFSSVASVLGNAGQADYAAANAYLDNYAWYRHTEMLKGNRHGKTLSINWPLWEAGGMQVDAATTTHLQRVWNMLPLPAEKGIAAFEQLLALPFYQGQVLYTKKAGNNIPAAYKPDLTKNGQPAADTALLQTAVKNQVRTMAAGVLKLEAGMIADDKAFGSYGFDSILFTRLANELNAYYDTGLLPVVFYNYPTVNDLAAFLVTDHPESVVARHGMVVQPPEQQQKITTAAAAVSKDQQPVAIVGISGRFPGAPDLAGFWKNLEANKDLVTEVPADRWDWQAYYGDAKKEKGKTRSKWGGFITDIDKFDPLFFNISPLEAELMDPQQRITIEAVYHVLEDAGISADRIKGSNTGVFIGVSGMDYALLVAQQPGLAGKAQFATGTAHSVLANRISYLFDLHGPSEPIDTACSSSLVAIHRAVESIRNGHCEMAVAGGVNALLSPALTLSFSQAGMLSEDGKCKTFDQLANGYVRGEGVGVVFLKPLHRAIAEGDHIYGVIYGTAENHGGRANTLTSPNPNAQRDLLVKAYASAGISPAEVSYIEAHGTGTALGDPIEIEGLRLAFAALYKQQSLTPAAIPYCGIGSVKANIGHLESAAGVAGVIKILLALQHKTLPGNPHLKTPNAYLTLEGSPFYLLDNTRDWPAADQALRVAGVSSFGFGGSNAHVIIKEYQPVQTAAFHSEVPAVIVLSARNEERLKAVVVNLLDFISTHPAAGIHDMACTLQTGREAMEERLGIIAADVQELQVLLSAYLQGRHDKLYTGNIKKERSSFLPATIEQAIEQQDGRTLAQLWVKGAVISWEMLYPSGAPRRISLPVYPFARERYWVPVVKGNGALNGTAVLHPLLHSNESDLHEQKYKSTYTGDEPFLSDHKVQGIKILPGVAYLELAREAGSRSLREPVRQIKDVIWQRPLMVQEEAATVYIQVYPSGEHTGYEVYTQQSGKQVHSKGTLVSQPPVAAPLHHLQQLRSRCMQLMEGKDCYALFESLGLQYGSSFQGIQQLYCGEGEALSRISLPAQEDYVLPPGLLDSALQTVIGLQTNQPSLALPYSVSEVNIYGDLPGSVWCYVRKSSSASADAAIAAYDIDLLDETGAVLLQFKEVVALPLDKDKTPNKVEETLLYLPVWERVAVQEKAAIPASGKHVLVTGKGANMLVNELQTILLKKGHEVIVLPDLAQLPANITALYLLQGLNGEERELNTFRSLRSLLSSGYKDQPLSIIAFTHNTQAVLSTDHVKADGSGIIGLTGSLAKEQPQWQLRVIDLDTTTTTADDLLKTLTLPADKAGNVRAYRNGHFYERNLYPVELPAIKESRFRRGGIYVILGGAGGLGRVTTEYLARTYQAQVIWLGRRTADAAITRYQDEIAQSGPRPVYISCDANNRQSVEQAYHTIKAAYGVVHGVIHSALVLHDMLLHNMEETDFRPSFDIKSLSSRHLSEVFGRDRLDFICFYSSVQSLWNAPGQGNYAAGSTYKDSYGYSIAQNGILVRIINWGYWGEVGVVSGEGYKQRMLQSGIGSIIATEGMQILETLLAGDQQQLAAIKFI